MFTVLQQFYCIFVQITVLKQSTKRAKIQAKFCIRSLGSGRPHFFGYRTTPL